MTTEGNRVVRTTATAARGRRRPRCATRAPTAPTPSGLWSLVTGLWSPTSLTTPRIHRRPRPAAIPSVLHHLAAGGVGVDQAGPPVRQLREDRQVGRLAVDR